jgi:DNA-binding LacI/PurR family transcriptional regulator
VRKVTLQDLADRLGVARSTASRALRGDSQISEATRRRVRRLALSLGYHPNAAARALTHRAAGVVGLVLPRSATFVFANPYFAELLEGIAAVAESVGLPLLLSASPAPDYERWLREARVDGLITLGSSLLEPDIQRLEALAAGGAAVALIGEPARPTGLRVVLCDERPGLEQACGCLAAAGHTAVALVAGPDQAYARHRSSLWRETGEASGLEFVRTIAGDDTLDAGRVAARELLRSRCPASAWLFGNDAMAFGALQVLGDAGLSAPEDASVVGFDDVMPAALLGLSTVRQPIRELGTEAMTAIAAELRRRPHPGGTLATRFVARRTTAAPPRTGHGTAKGGR